LLHDTCILNNVPSVVTAAAGVVTAAAGVVTAAAAVCASVEPER